MRTLLLLRHAKSSWDDEGADDRVRPLAPRGVRAAARMGAHLAEQAPLDLVLCSTARRAAETWERASAALGPAPPVAFDDALYLASPARILARVRRVPHGVRRLLVVGHNPGFHELALQLAGAGGDAARAAAERIGKFPTGALAAFELARGDWSELGRAPTRLVAFVRPKDLAP
jgi:phosphohistidine phosphatase